MKSIIFCQAPSRIGEVLNCYEQERKERREVVIVVRNTHNCYLFLNELHLNAIVLFFDNPPSQRDVFTVKKKIKDDIKTLNIEIEDRIFFTDYDDDPFMGIYLAALNTHPIIWISPLTVLPTSIDRKGLPFIYKLRERVFSIMYGYSFRYTRIDHWSLSINKQKYHYPEAKFKDLSVFSRYKIQPDVDFASGQHVIFFTEPYRNKFHTQQDYDNLNRLIIEELHKLGFKVSVKGHPRIGCHPLAQEMCDYVISNYIPSEFLDVSNFKFAIGFVSTSLCSASEQIKAYTVLPMCKVVDEKQYNYWIDYVQRNQKTGYVHFIKEFKEILQ